SYVRGDKASWTAHGDFLFGAPMAGAGVALRVTRVQTWFRPPGLDAFWFDDQAYRSGRHDANEAGYEVQSSRAKLDPKGAAAIEAARALPGQQGPEIVTAEASVTDLSRQTIAASTSAVVHPGEFYVALDPGADLFVKETDPIKPKVLAADPKGARVAGVPV